jgi:hypothetical protein
LAKVGDQHLPDIVRQRQQVNPVSLATDPDGPINPIDVFQAQRGHFAAAQAQT